ncbi:MAG: hypothetical protein ACMG55_05210 [Microcoleus sp.]
MDTNPEAGQQTRDTRENGAGDDSSNAIQEARAEKASKIGLSDFDVLMELEELHPGFIELVLVRIPDSRQETISSYLSVAIQEATVELGKERLVEITATKAISEPSLPSLKALIRLEELHPQFIERVFVRMQEIQQQTQKSELDASQKQKPRKIGRAITDIFNKKP